MRDLLETHDGTVTGPGAVVPEWIIARTVANCAEALHTRTGLRLD